MQVKPYSSYYDTQIANLLNQLVIKADEASRCQEILDRLNGLDRDTKVPVDVVDFIGNYAPIEIVSNEGLISKGIDVIKKALEGLMKAIIWIIQKLKEIFKYCFDAEYRACKDTLDLQRRIIVISANLTACTKFGGLNCDVISKKDIDDIIFKTQQLTELIANAAKMSDQTYIEVLMNTFGTQAGISKDGNNVLTDNIPNPVPLRNVTYGSAGWDISGITSTITNYLSMLRGIEGLKEVNRSVEAAAKDFKRRAEQAALNGATAGDVVALQINGNDCGVSANWGGWGETEVAIGMPLTVFFNGNDRSRLAVAASECSRHIKTMRGIREEGSFVEMSFTYFDQAEAPIAHYETAIRIDRRDIYFGDAIRESVAWMEKTGGYTPCKAPEAAFDPLYSTWYCFHQDVYGKDIEEELEIAAKLGMKTVILDDGWQTENNNRLYAFCGDWEVARKRFPDMAAHVKKVHGLGMKYMVWYSVPFIGFESANYGRFKGRYLREDRGMRAAVLDPRFPEVRRFLVDTYARAMKEWDLDGFKLDFIDAIRFWGEDPAEKENFKGRDIKSVPIAVEKLMTEVHAALTAIKPDALVEFRQGYVGPGIRKFGNMLRVGDCPGSARRNRVAIANLRLASGDTAVHSDMLEWHFSETPEQSAIYIINSMFGVIQYSVMLRQAPKEHLAMIEKWIKFSQDHRDTLLHGKFTPHHPELLYPVVEAESERELIIGLYDDGRILDVPADKKTIVMNASGADSFVIRRGGKMSTVACRSGDWIEL